MRAVFLATILLVIGGTFLSGSAVQAAQLPGSGGSRFVAAVELWLADNDAESLPELAVLAAEGNVAARLFLARIEHFDRGPSPWRAGLSPNDHKTLFRAPEEWSSFQRSWLQIEAEAGNALAENLLAAKRPVPNPALIYALTEAGEVQATDHPIRILALYGSAAQKELLLEQDWMLDELRPYVEYNTHAAQSRGDGIAALRHIVGADSLTTEDPATQSMADILALGYGFGSMDADNPWRGPVENWLITAPSMLPLQAACSNSCTAKETSACAFTLMALTGGYYEAVRLDSPLESVVSQPDFLASPRARMMALRRAAMARSEMDEIMASVDDIAKHSICAAQMVKDLRAAY